MVKTVKFRNSHHVANLGVLVGLGTKKWLAIDHGDRILASLFQSTEVTKIGSGVDKSSTNSVGVSGDGANNTNTGSLGLGHIVHKKVNQKKVPQMVDAHAHFKTIVGPGWFGVGGSVDGGVTDKVGQRSNRFEGLKVGNKVANTLKTGEFELHDGVRVVGHALFLGDCIIEKRVNDISSLSET